MFRLLFYWLLGSLIAKLNSFLENFKTMLTFGQFIRFVYKLYNRRMLNIRAKLSAKRCCLWSEVIKVGEVDLVLTKAKLFLGEVNRNFAPGVSLNYIKGFDGQTSQIIFKL